MLLLLLVLLLALPGFAEPQAVITVDVTASQGPVNRLVFGNNQVGYDPFMIFSATSSPENRMYGAGLWDPELRAPIPEALRYAREMGIPISRFPGGCGVHSYDWKKTIGPVAERPDWQFGVDEFLEWCQAADSKPLINVSDYTGTAQDAADLVEYLNSPADEAHPWAQQRAANGHPEPWGVKWFELGNETDHGNHEMQPKRKMSAEEYGNWVIEYSRAMKAVDPTIKVSALMGTGTFPDDPWNATVLALVKDDADFIVWHVYPVSLWGEDPPQSADTLMKAALAASEQWQYYLAEYNKLILEHCGKQLPIAITEYNAAFVQEKPIPYRFSLGAALFSADWIRVMLEPDSNVVMGNYWQFINEYWGELQGPRYPGDPRPYKPQPAYYVHQLWNNHFGAELVKTEVTGPTFESEGYNNVLPARGETLRPKPVVLEDDLSGTVSPNQLAGEGWRLETAGEEFIWRLGEITGDFYPQVASILWSPDQDCVVSGEARYEGAEGSGKLGIQIGDSRGWLETHSAAAKDDLQLATDWEPFKLTYKPLRDTKALQLVLRCQGRQAGSTGALHLRNLKLRRALPALFPAAQTLTASASRSEDGSKLYLMVVNKSRGEALTARLDLTGFVPGAIHTWTLTGPSLESNNLAEATCVVTEADVPVGTGPLELTFAPRSLTAVELSR